MRLTISTLITAAAVISTPAFAQVAGSGNLVGTQGQQPNWPGVPHQSTTMVNAGGGTRGVIAGVNGGDLAPGVKTDKLVVLPAAARNGTPNRSAGGYVQVGAQKGGLGNGVTVRADGSNNLGAGPKDTYRSIDVNTPKGVGNAAGGALGGHLAGANAAGGAVGSAASKLPGG